ncbi:DUF4239 domain-containing protein [Candidatus Roizmanbacteria bacterium]|nr:DUF4239 domain-containing protein [Candidatus Roizmanbacteria bacterium]
MYLRKIIFKVIAFIFFFSIVFFGIRYFNLLPQEKLNQNINSIPWLFSAISLVFSILSGFVIQSKWQTWDSLIDAIRGELSAFRQLNILANHLPEARQQKMRYEICNYLDLLIHDPWENQDKGIRSEKIEKALTQLEDFIFTESNKASGIGHIAFELLSKIMECREQRLQNSGRHMPVMLRAFIILATYTIIFTSLFIGVNTISYDYIFTVLIALLSYGIYLLIDDLDHPYRPGNWHVKNDEYKAFLSEVSEKCGYVIAR